MLHKHIPTQNSGLYLCDVFFHSIYTAYRLRISGHYQVSSQHTFELFALTSSHVNLSLVSSAFSIEVYEHLLSSLSGSFSSSVSSKLHRSLLFRCTFAKSISSDTRGVCVFHSHAHQGQFDLVSASHANMCRNCTFVQGFSMLLRRHR